MVQEQTMQYDTDSMFTGYDVFARYIVLAWTHGKISPANTAEELKLKTLRDAINTSEADSPKLNAEFVSFLKS